MTTGPKGRGPYYLAFIAAIPAAVVGAYFWWWLISTLLRLSKGE